MRTHNGTARAPGTHRSFTAKIAKNAKNIAKTIILEPSHHRTERPQIAQINADSIAPSGQDFSGKR